MDRSDDGDTEDKENESKASGKLRIWVLKFYRCEPKEFLIIFCFGISQKDQTWKENNQ